MCECLETMDIFNLLSSIRVIYVVNVLVFVFSLFCLELISRKRLSIWIKQFYFYLDTCYVHSDRVSIAQQMFLIVFEFVR